MRQSSVAIPRRYLEHKDNSFNLHLFRGASEAACCAVVYMVEGTKENGTICTFLAIRYKVTLLKPLSVPCLELQAALIAARLADTFKKKSQALISSTYYWTDSTTVLCWLLHLRRQLAGGDRRAEPHG